MSNDRAVISQDPSEPEVRTAIASQQRDLVSRIKLLWQRNGCPDAISFLSENDTMRGNRSLVLELAYEEYCIRRDQGEAVDASLFCRRFPSISRSLFRQIEVEEYVRNDPSVVLSHQAIAWPRRGEQLFGFVVVEEIGRGAFARAYLCAESGLGNRQVVVKVAFAGASEADTMGGLNHPNIMTVHSVQVDPATKMTGICMPFCGRSTLYDVIDVAFGGAKVPTKAGVILEGARALSRRGDRYLQMTPKVPIRPGATYITGVLRVATQIADALSHSHERGVLHGDLKPSNIVMSIDGIPLLVDFNLSQSRDSQNLITGGTLPYMAPEQIRSMLLGADEEDRVDERSDIFSMAAILFEMLTGRPPFGDLNHDMEPMLMAGQMLDEQTAGPRSIQQRNAYVPTRLAELIGRCLSFDPSARPRSMREVLFDLERQLSAYHRSRRFLRQRRGLSAGLVLAGLAACGGLAIWQQRQPAARERYFREGVDAYHARDYHAALEAFNQAISEDPEFGEAYFARGCVGLAQYQVEGFTGWLESAYKDLNFATRCYSSQDVIDVRAYCLVQQNEYEIVEREYRSMVGRGLMSADRLNNLAYCLLKQPIDNRVSELSTAERLEEADVLLNQAIHLQPDLWQAHYNLGMLELTRYSFSNKARLPRRGLEAMRQMIRLNPNDAATFYFAGKIAGILAIHDSDAILVAECVRYMERAADLGHAFDVAILETVHPLRELMSDPHFSRVVRRPKVAKVASSADRVAKPPVMDSLFVDFVPES